MTFNLIDQPWIPGVNQDWQCHDRSLIQLFQTWEDLRAIQAENPPTTLAIYRFLLALLHHVYQGPKDVDDWEAIQEDNGARVITYLQDKQDLFDLFHPDRPFMQDPALKEDKAVSIHAIHTMSTSQVFSHEHEYSGYCISPAAAARLLVRLQTVDITSLRAFYPPQKAGNRSAVNTPTINNATLLLGGETLQETLLSNLMHYNPQANMPSDLLGEDLPAWETGYAGEPQKVGPNGYISYLAYPWRRLRLFYEEEGIRQIAITMGNSLPDGVGIHQWECHVPFQTTKEKRPLRFSMEQQLWRDSHYFLHTSDTHDRPQIVNWLATLRAGEPVGNLIRFQVFGFCADKAKPLGWAIDQFSAPILYATDTQLGAALRRAIAIADEHQQIFRAFRGSPYYALAEVLKNGEPGNLAASLDGESRYWAALDRAFPELLATLPSDKTIDGNGITYGNTKLPEWTTTVQKAARDAFTQSIAPIRNYEARAKALKTLEWWLADLRASPEEKEARKAKAAAKKKEKASK